MRRLFCITAVCMASFAAHAEDLWDVYQLAKQNDPAFQAAQLTFQAEQQNIPIARSALLPSLDATASHGRKRDKNVSSQPFLTQGTASYTADDYSLEFSQSLFDWGKWQGFKQAKSLVEVARFQFENARLELALRVAVRYFAVLAAQDNLEVASSERLANTRQLELAQERLEVGLGTKTDLYDAEARFRLAQSQEISARNQVDDAQRALAEVTGAMPGTLAKLNADQTLAVPQPAEPDHWVQKALDGNLDLFISRQQEQVAQHALKISQAGHLPSLDLVADHDYVDNQGSVAGPGSARTNTYARIQLTVPLLQGGSVLATTKQARLRFEAAQRQTERALRLTERNARSSYLGITTSVQQVKALGQAVVASESALEAKQEGFQAGLNTNIDVLNGQRDLYLAKRDYLNARYNYILNWLRLKQVLGSLSEEDLRQTRAWLEQS